MVRKYGTSSRMERMTARIEVCDRRRAESIHNILDHIFQEASAWSDVTIARNCFRIYRRAIHSMAAGHSIDFLDVP